jgi:hypothetical protein
LIHCFLLLFALFLNCAYVCRFYLFCFSWQEIGASLFRRILIISYLWRCNKPLATVMTYTQLGQGQEPILERRESLLPLDLERREPQGKKSKETKVKVKKLRISSMRLC